MAERSQDCKGKNSDSSCTCETMNACKNYTYSSSNEKASPKSCDCDDLKTSLKRSTNKLQTPQCTSDCTNCKLLNRLYELLQEIVSSGKNAKKTEEVKKDEDDTITKQLFRRDTDRLKALENYRARKSTLKSIRESIKPKDLYNNTTASNLCPCCNRGGNSNEKTDSAEYSNINETIRQTCTCSKTEDSNMNQILRQICRRNDDSNNNETIRQSCTCRKNDDSNINETIRQTCPCRKNEDSNINETIRQTCPCRKNEDSNLNETIRQTCSCRKNDDIPRSSAQYWRCIGKKQEVADCGCQCNCQCEENTSSTTSADSTMVKNLLNDPNFRDALKLMPPNIVVLTNGCSCCNKNNAPVERTSVTTNTSDLLVSRQDKEDNEQSLGTDTEQILQETVLPLDGKSRESTSVRKSILQNTRKSALYEDTTFMVPPEQEFTVQSALVVGKGGKKKAAPKGKKRKSKGRAQSKESDEIQQQRPMTVPCCQAEQIVQEKLTCSKNTKDAGICCEILQNNLANAEKPSTPKLMGSESCKCTDIKNFFSSMMDLFNDMQKKTDEPKKCGCNINKVNNLRKSLAANTNKDDACVEIQRLAEQIVEIHIKSNQNKGKDDCLTRNENKGFYNATRTNNECNCINVGNALPPPTRETPDGCYCKVCPCAKCTRTDRREIFSKKKEKCKCSISPQVKRATRKYTGNEFDEFRWIQEYPERRPTINGNKQRCTCKNFECMEETEIGLYDYQVPDRPKENGTCQNEKCPHLHRIAKECLCGTKNCYCHNEELNDLKTTANLERLADEVINAITPCTCMTCECGCRIQMDSNTRQVCLSSIYHEKQGKISNVSAKEKRLFDKDVNGNPCLAGSKTETKLYIENLLDFNKKQPWKPTPAAKKLIKSAKTLKPLILSPSLPISGNACPHTNYINTLYPEVVEALKKIRQLTNQDVLPQEIVEIVIDKVLKKEIKCALQQMREGVFKVNTNESGNKKDTNILNILMEDKNEVAENIKEFKNNILDKRLKPTKQPLNMKEEIIQDTLNLVQDSKKDNNTQLKLETVNINQEDLNTNKKPILVQINIEKAKKSPSKNQNILETEIKSTTSINEIASSSSIYITENKMESIKQLIFGKNSKPQIVEDDKIDSGSILSFKESSKPISININIEMDKTSKVNKIDSETNTDEIKIQKTLSSPKLKETIIDDVVTISSKNELKKSDVDINKLNYLYEGNIGKRQISSIISSKLKETITEETISISPKKELEKSDVDIGKFSYISDRNTRKRPKSNITLKGRNSINAPDTKNELPSLEDFLALNNTMKVEKIKLSTRK